MATDTPQGLSRRRFLRVLGLSAAIVPMASAWKKNRGYGLSPYGFSYGR